MLKNLTEIRSELHDLPLDVGEIAPSESVVNSVIQLLEDAAKTKSIDYPDVSTFYGELDLTWRNCEREITLMSKGRSDDPRIHYHEFRSGAPSEYRMETRVTSATLDAAFTWLADPERKDA